MSPGIRVAIVGGSLSGCTLARALLRYSNIRFDVFESKPVFAERGQGVTISLNGENSLIEMGLPVDDMFRTSGAVVGERPPRCIGYGEYKGKQLFEQPPGWRYVVTRTRWLAELLKDIPEDRLHANKLLVEITEASETDLYTLHFQDGTTCQADVVVGCDGLHSKVRQVLLGPSHPDCLEPSFGSYWDTRARTTPAKAAKCLGKELFDPEKLHKVGVAGDGSFMLFSPTDDGKTYGIIVASRASSNYDTSSRQVALTRDLLEDSFRSWDTPFRDAVIDCLLGDEEGPGVVFSLWESPPTPTYVRDRLCILGDAAHTMLPCMGQGANMAMEDVAVLAAVLGAVDRRRELSQALQAYDQVRHERPEFITKHSREVAKLVTGQFGLDPEKTAHVDTSKWWDYAFNIDMKAHIEEAVRIFKASLG